MFFQSKLIEKNIIMKALYIYIFILCNLICNAGSPKSWSNSMSVEQNIAENSITLTNSTDFSFLDEIAQSKFIILLGESGHYELKTTEAKVSMINYLEEKGYHAVGMETAPFLSSYVYSNSEYIDYTKDWKLDYLISPVFTSQETFKPLFEKIEKRQIKLLGIDNKLGIYDIMSASYILEKYEKEYPFEFDWNRFYKLYMSRLVFYMYPDSYKPLTKSEEFELMNNVNDLSNYIHLILSRKGQSKDLKALKQWISIVKEAFPFIEKTKIIYEKDAKVDTTSYVYFEKNRDEIMSKNTVWHLSNSPDEKFTIWCHNYHGALELSQIVEPTDSIRNFMRQPMGEFLVNSHVGNKIYSIAFTSKNVYSGKTDGRLELAIMDVTKNAPFAYIDFKKLRFTEGYYNKEFKTFFANKKNGKWLFAFDGVYYIRDQKLNTEMKLE